MADPGSILALLASCATLAATTAKSLKDIHDYRQSYKNVPDIMQYLKSDTTTAKNILDAISSPDRPLLDERRLPIRDNLTTCEHVLRRLRDIAEQYRKERHGFKRFVSHVKFTFDETEVARLREELHKQIQYLIIIRDLQESSPNAYENQQAERTPTGLPLVPDGNIHELLIEAADIGSVKAIKACLDAKVDIDYQSRSRHQDRNGRAAIHLVAKRGQLAALEVLIEGRVDVDLIEPIDVETALHIAARNGHAKMVRCLVSQKVDLDVRNIHGLTPLMVASTEGIQAILLDAGASPNINDRDGIPILHATIRRGFVRTVRKLVAKGAQINQLDGAGRHALGIAYDFSKASEEAAAEMIEILLISSAPRNRISNGDKVELLLLAANKNKLKILRTLLNNDADILSRLSPQGLSPLHMVARTGPVDILQEMLRYARDVNIRDANRQTPLHHAIMFNNAPCVRLLLNSSHADLQSRDIDGLTPLHLAFHFAKEPTIVSLLLQAHTARKTTINILDNTDRLPIHMASSPDLVSLWVQHGGYVTTCTIPGHPPIERSVLRHAVLYQSPAIISALLTHGARTTAHIKQPLESLCANEPLWKTPSGVLSPQRLAVFKILLQHTALTQTCRDSIAKWEDKSLRDALSKEVPGRSLMERATSAGSWTLFTAVPAVAGGAYIVAGFVNNVGRFARGR